MSPNDQKSRLGTNFRLIMVMNLLYTRSSAIIENITVNKREYNITGGEILLNISVVDDDITFLSMYSKEIMKSFTKNDFSVSIDEYSTGNELIDSLEYKKYDLIFMDIDMPEISGIDLAAELRKNNQNFDMIFVSAHPHFVFEAIRFTPYRFIRKSNLVSETSEAVDSYCLKIQNDHKMILLELQNGRIFNEKVDIISDFFTVRHDVYYTSGNENNAVILSRKYSLSQLENMTKPYGFIRVHKSHLVNYRYIRNINTKSVILTNNREIPVSHGKKTEIQERFMELLRNGNTS